MPRRRRNSEVKRHQTPLRMTQEAQARRIMARLEVLGWTQVRLAQQIGMSTPDLNKLLKGRRKHGMDAELAWRIARAIGLSPHYIMFGDTDRLAPEALEKLPPEND